MLSHEEREDERRRELHTSAHAEQALEEVGQRYFCRVQEAVQEDERMQDWARAQEVWSPDPGMDAAPRYG
eukprot:5149168-Alexandrium_andersonii.AAC.1